MSLLLSPTYGFESLLTADVTRPQSLYALLSQLGAPPPVAPVLTYQWMYVERRFGQLLETLTITRTQREDGETKQAAIRACLNRWYWGHGSEAANSMLIGSWGKDTRLRPSRDIDILFLLPSEVYWRFDRRSDNRQSQLLQEVKYAIGQAYSQTTLRGDGQVVSVPFSSIPIEIVPGFRCTDGSIIICDANDGGRYKTSTAEAEVRDLDASDRAWNGNTRSLVRMMKQWQRERNVPLKSFALERLAVEFLSIWPFSHHDLFWYDWMIRDFLGYLVGRVNGYLFMPGTGEIIALGSEWLSRAQTAYGYAVRACDYERANYQALAGDDWQQIFGSAVPVLVS
jgi:Second Messenger Oligonucleotide or Dinucleotide Synthetase domain